LGTRVGWTSADGNPFYHEEILSEQAVYNYSGQLMVTKGGTFGIRTPILHPAVAAVDVAQAGIDDAFLRAIQNVDALVGGGVRNDSSSSTRQLCMRYARRTYNPMRVLVRAAVVVANCMMRGNLEEAFNFRVTGVTAAPRIVNTAIGFGNACGQQLADPSDVLFVSCDSPAESYMVDVMLSLCSHDFPYISNGTVTQLWPALDRPTVMAAGVTEYGLPAMSAKYDEIIHTMRRFCDIFDCHDLWFDALGLVQGYSCRPEGAGVLAGAMRVTISLPASDMRIGAIGPLMAGLSAEGMKSQPFVIPTRAEFLYSSAVRGVMLSAAYYQELQSYSEAHPVRLTSEIDRAPRYEVLTRQYESRAFMSKKVRLVADAAGWDIVSDVVSSVSITPSRKCVRNAMRAHLTPWWTLILRHLQRDWAQAHVEGWLLPAVPTGEVTPKQWQTYKAIGLTTNAQMVSAVRWLTGKVCYTKVQMGADTKITKVAMGGHTRFGPNLSPSVIGHEGAKWYGAMRFDDTYYRQRKFVNAMAASKVTVYPYSTGELPGEVDAASDAGGDDDEDNESEDFTELRESQGVLPTEAAPSSGEQAAGMQQLIERERQRPTEQELEDDAPLVPVPTPDPSAQFRLTDAEAELLEGRLQECGTQLDAGAVKEAVAALGTAGSERLRTNLSRLIEGQLDGFVRASEPQVAYDNVVALRKALSLFSRYQSTDVTTTAAMSRKYTEVFRAQEELRRHLDTPRRWEVPSGSAEEALAEGLANGGVTSAIDVPVAPDDPTGPTETVADFGQTMLPHASMPGEINADVAAPGIQEGPTIGFTAPTGSIHFAD
jgi:hypothetical protein